MARIKSSGAKGIRIGNTLFKGTANSVIFIDSSGKIAQDNPGFTYVPGTGLTLDDAINVPEIFNSGGDLKIMPDVQGNVTLFEDTDVADDANGKKLIITRKAVEGDDTIDIFINEFKQSVLDSNASGGLWLGSNATSLHLISGAGGDLKIFETSSSGENNSFTQAGFITNGSNEVEIMWTVKDTDDYFYLERENANILGFKIDMPLDLIDNNLITTGTIQGGTLTDGTLSINSGSITNGISGTFSEDVSAMNLIGNNLLADFINNVANESFMDLTNSGVIDVLNSDFANVGNIAGSDVNISAGTGVYTSTGNLVLGNNFSIITDGTGGLDVVMGIDNNSTPDLNNIFIGGINETGDRFYNVLTCFLYGRTVLLGDSASGNTQVTVSGGLRINADNSPLTGAWALDIDIDNASGFRLISTAASGPSSGAGIQFGLNDGSAMAQGDRLGFLVYIGGNGTGTRNAAAFTAFASELWDANSSGSEIRFETTPNGTNSRAARWIVENDGDFVAQSAFDIITTGDAQIGRIGINTSPSSPFNLVAQATDTNLMNIDGTTNDFTGTGSASTPRALLFQRDLNAGNGNEPLPFTGLSAELNFKHTLADITNNNKTYTVLQGNWNDTSTWTTSSASDRFVLPRSLFAKANSDGTYNSTGTGRIIVQARNVRSSMDFDPTFNASGGATNLLETYGNYIDMNISPTLASGALIVRNKGLWISLTGTTVGTSTNIGIEISVVTGADTNWGIFDGSGADWALDGDSQKIRWGEGQDVAISFDGSDMIINSQNVTANDEIHFVNFDRYVFDNDITLSNTAFLIMDKASGNGIKVDTATPTFGFGDIIGDQFSKNTGATKPTLTTYNGVINSWLFGVGDEAFISFHIPHDYVAGSEIFLHIHWSHIATTVTGGTVTFKATSIYAKAHNQTPFQSTPATGTFTGTASTVQYQQILSEASYSASTPTGIQIDQDDIEPDGVIELTFEVDANDITVSSGGVPDIFVHFVDIHYQTTGLIGTKDKAPDFYA